MNTARSVERYPFVSEHSRPIVVGRLPQASDCIAQVADLGPRIGARQPCRIHRRNRRTSLFLRSLESLAGYSNSISFDRGARQEVAAPTGRLRCSLRALHIRASGCRPLQITTFETAAAVPTAEKAIARNGTGTRI